METAAICLSVKPSSGQAASTFPAAGFGIQARSDKILAAAAYPVLAFEQLLRTRGGAGFLATPTADSLSSCLRNSLGEASIRTPPSTHSHHMYGFSLNITVKSMKNSESKFLGKIFLDRMSYRRQSFAITFGFCQAQCCQFSLSP